MDRTQSINDENLMEEGKLKVDEKVSQFKVGKFNIENHLYGDCNLSPKIPIKFESL